MQLADNLSKFKKALFIYGSVFFILMIAWNLDLIPGMRSFVPWFSDQFLDIQIESFTNGSGDTTYDHIYILLITAITLVSGTIWIQIDSTQKSYDIPMYWMNLIIRYFLGYMMFTYGLVKILHIQFRPPNLTELLMPFGDRSPMGLAWAYMGHSKGFGIILGIAEILVAFLLLFRKTYILGACVGIFVCVNIFAVNLFFDVPVKLFSGLLLLMSVFLVIPDLQRLLQFFILNQPTQPKAFPIALQSRLAKITRCGMLGLYIVALCYVGHMYYTYRPPAGGAESITPLYGIYNVKHFVKEGDTIPPLTTDSVRWSQLIIQKPGSAQIKFMNGRIRTVDIEVDQDKQELVLVKKEGDNSINSILKYKIINEDLKILGKLEEIDHAIDLEKYDLQKFRLINTPFRWINEYPDNK